MRFSMRKVKMKSLVIGMGIGQLYKGVLESQGHTVVTVDRDANKGADYTDITEAITNHGFFDTAHICTPNFTHMAICDIVAPVSKVVFVEKPGAASTAEWISLIERHPTTRITMVKNNQWRPEFSMFQEYYDKSNEIWLRWINKDRVPNPGTWFTNKELAFGGVSRDLMPHLLSYVSSFCNNFHMLQVTHKHSAQRWTLADVSQTDYGIVDPNGVYDVDDIAELTLEGFDKKMTLKADWRSDDKTDIGIAFGNSSSAMKFELGLCPEEAYLAMINECVEKVNEQAFWLNQYNQDVWIHDMMELLNG
jgi:predicted dehydrogenase